MDDLRSSEVLTSNMVAMLVLKYNRNRQKFFELLPFLDDLEHVEMLNRTTIRLFKTQREVDEFKLMETQTAV
jgi:hypothetical protein